MIMDRPAISSPRFPRVRPSRYQAAMNKGPPDRTGEEQPNVKRAGPSHGRPTAASGAKAPLGTIQPEQLAREGPA